MQAQQPNANRKKKPEMVWNHFLRRDLKDILREKEISPADKIDFVAEKKKKKKRLNYRNIRIFVFNIIKSS